MLPPCISARVLKAADMIDVSPATFWNKLNQDKIEFFRDGGITRVVIDWIGDPPPREGRRPSLREYISERIAETADQPKRATPEGVHKGRPHLQPSAE
jgi:hypothetical protein